METEYEYGIAKRNDGLYVIYRNKRNSNIYEYLYDRNSNVAYVPMGNGQYTFPEFSSAWTSIVENAWTSYKGMKKEVIVKLINKAIQCDIEFQQRFTATQIKERMSVEDFLKNED